MSSGGRIPSVVSVMESPSLTVLTDGRILLMTEGPAPQVIPSRYDVATVSPEEVGTFVETAQSAALVDVRTDFGNPRIADAATTTVILRGDDRTDEVRVYALDERFDHRLSPVQRDARERLRAMIDSARELAASAPRSPYVPERVVVSEPLPDRNRETATVMWPGPPPAAFMLPTQGRAIASGQLVGEDARTVYRAALGNPGARWLVNGSTRVLGVNPFPLQDV